MRTTVPSSLGSILTSSAKPVMTARPRPGEKPEIPPGGVSSPSRNNPSMAGGSVDSSYPFAGAQSVTTTSKRRVVMPLARRSFSAVPSPDSEDVSGPLLSISWSRIGCVGQWTLCAATAREHASPTASLISSIAEAAIPARRATVAAMSRAVRTWAGSALIVSVMVAIARSGLLRRTLVDGFLDRVVDTENLGQAGDPENLEDALLSAHQVQCPVVRTDTLQPAHEHTEAGR